MKLVLSVGAFALMLAGCADGYDKSAANLTCKRLVREDRPIAVPMSGPGLVMGDRYVIPGRDLGGSGKLDKDWPNSASCIPQKGSGAKSPKLYDWHRIGMVL